MINVTWSVGPVIEGDRWICAYHLPIPPTIVYRHADTVIIVAIIIIIIIIIIQIAMLRLQDIFFSKLWGPLKFWEECLWKAVNLVWVSIWGCFGGRRLARGSGLTTDAYPLHQ